MRFCGGMLRRSEGGGGAGLRAGYIHWIPSYTAYRNGLDFESRFHGCNVTRVM